MVRNATSMIWYSSEVAGTIIVQCIPILRPFIRDIHTSLTSKRLADTNENEARTQSNTWRSTIDGKRGSGSAYSDGKRISAYKNQSVPLTAFDGKDGKKMGTTTEVFALSDIPEDREHETIYEHEHETGVEVMGEKHKHEHDAINEVEDDETEQEILGWKKGFGSSTNSGHKQARSEASSDTIHNTPTMPAGPLPGHPGNHWRFSETSTVAAQSPATGAGTGSWMDFMERDKQRERARDSDEEMGVGVVPLAPMPVPRNFSRGGR